MEVDNIDDNLLSGYKRSNYAPNDVGVPQGSVLGPLLFLLYINDLPNISKYKCVLFADDISIVIPCKNITTYNDDINNLIKNVVRWLESNNLKVNLDKTKYIQFYNRKGGLDINVEYDNVNISESDEHKFLGIILDKNFSWKPQINKKCKMINSFVYPIRRLAAVVNKETALIAYHGYVASVLRYGLLLWGNSYDIERLFISQKKCIRAICNKPPLTSCKQLFDELKVLTLPSLYILEMSKFVKSNFNLFTQLKNVCKFNTRYPQKLVQRKTASKLRQRNCCCMAIKIFNNIPEEIKILPYNRFVSALCKWLLEKRFYCIKEFLSLKQINNN